MNKQVETIRQEIERLKKICKDNITTSKSGSFPYVMEMTGYDKILAFIDSLPDEDDFADFSKIAEDLEKAARLCAIPPYMKDVDENFLDEYPYNPVAEKAFIKGARWQYQKDRYGFSVMKAKNWEEGFNDGRKAEKEKMMKEAIHYVVQDDLDSQGGSYNIPFIRIGITALKPKGIGVGDKVKIIILKEDKEDGK